MNIAEASIGMEANEKRGVISPRIQQLISSPSAHDIYPSKREVQQYFPNHFVFGPGASGERFTLQVFYRAESEDFVWGGAAHTFDSAFRPF